MNSRDPVTRDHAENRPAVESNYEILQKTLQMIFVLFIFLTIPCLHIIKFGHCYLP